MTTSISSNAEEMIEEKLLDKLVVNMLEPAIKAVPSTTESTVRTKRNLCDMIVRKEIVRMGERSGLRVAVLTVAMITCPQSWP